MVYYYEMLQYHVLIFGCSLCFLFLFSPPPINHIKKRRRAYYRPIRRLFEKDHICKKVHGQVGEPLHSL